MKGKGARMNRRTSWAKVIWGRMAVAAGLMTMIVALAVGAVGCSTTDTGGDTTEAPPGDTTASVAPTIGSDSPATTETRVVVGGKTVEEYESQLPDLQKTVDENPTDLAALQDLAVAQYNTGRLGDAAATYQKMLQIKDDPTVHNNYGNVLRDQGKSDEALAEYLLAIAGDKALTVAYINAASMYVRGEKIAEALSVLDQGIAHTVGEDRTRLQNYKTTLTQKK